ncbi:FG-GAP repeat domain-containing protein [Polyangium sorediatum]|uniref:VCBS repeat-containing protein n=1 Tax=Polyangium sorediatum TaxID=889274 RepID=A0ABT6NJQ1_9BACT|nr:VCBS repeat-containing protein [Polyangium sorediatum]MDI1428534.1 VCBS repeat-containing protein [Polyangium sorediatum]
MFRSIFTTIFFLLGAAAFGACASSGDPDAGSTSSSSSTSSGTGGAGGTSGSGGTGGTGGAGGSGGAGALFKAPASYVVGADLSPPLWLAGGDLDGDGATDIVTANSQQDNTYTILRGKGDGTFGPPETFPVAMNMNTILLFSVAIGDLSGDGKADIALSHLGTVSVLVNQGDGTFPPQSMSASYEALGQGMHLVVRDVNADGLEDLIVPGQSGIGVHVLLGKPDETLATAITSPAGTAPISIATADFDGNGSLDLAVAAYDDVRILLGQGDGIFAAAIGYPAGKLARAVATGDFNGDGHIDLVAANAESNDMSVLLGKGDGTFQAAVHHPSGGAPMAIGVADFDGDGHADVAVENFTTSDLSLFLGNGDGTFQPLQKLALGLSPNGLIIDDFDKNGRPDIAVANHQDRDVLVLLNAGP